MIEQPVCHYVFLNPGEKLFVITDKLAGEDSTQVVEVVFPTVTSHGALYFDPKNGCHQESCGAFELNAVMNLIHGDGEQPPDNVTAAIARHWSAIHDETPFVTVPLSWVDRITRKEQNEADQKILTKCGVEIMTDEGKE